MANELMLASAEDLQKIIDMIPCPVFMKDAELRMVFMNETMVAYSGRPPDALLGKSEFDIVSEDQKTIHQGWDRHVLETGETVEYEQYLITKDGERKIGVIRKARLMLGPNRDLPFLLGTLSDVTAYRQAVAKSEHLSRHDTLTGLPNRMFFQERLAEAMGDAAQVENLAMLLIDLDGFKAVNDTHGHGAGDKLLCKMAHRLQKTVRADDMVARLGGDEFGILLCGGSALRQATLRVAEAVCRAVASPVRIEEVNADVSASIGIAYFSETGITPNELMRRADLAMYNMKRGGRNGVREYTAEMEPVGV